MFGMGGDVMASVALSRGEKKRANDILMRTVVASVVVSGLLTIFLCLFPVEAGMIPGSDGYLSGKESGSPFCTYHHTSGLDKCGVSHDNRNNTASCLNNHSCQTRNSFLAVTSKYPQTHLVLLPRLKNQICTWQRGFGLSL